MKFQERLKFVASASNFSTDKKEQASRQQEVERASEIVQAVVCLAVCDVLCLLLGDGTHISDNMGHELVQLTFHQFRLQAD